MSASVPFAEIASAALAHASRLVPEWLPAGRLRGQEFVCGGLDGSPGESLSINIKRGMWSDFATGEKGGDLISLYAAINRKSQVDAARELSQSLGTSSAPAAVHASDDWTIITPVPDHASPPPAAHFKHGKPVHIARYRNVDGDLIHLIYRCEPEVGKKEVLPLAWCRRIDGREEWRWKSQAKPRSLYGAEEIAGTNQILIVEGEGKADAARRMLADYPITVVAWPGGANAVAHADWSMLAGRYCVIWPDADPIGHTAAAQITIQLRHHGATARTVELPRDVPKGWISPMQRWTDGMAVGSWDTSIHQSPRMNLNLTTITMNLRLLRKRSITPHSAIIWGGSISIPREVGRSATSPRATSRPAGSLCELAPLRYWEANFPTKGDGFNTRAAGDALVRACYKIGIFDPDRIRGRGAWIDEGKSVLHMGDKLIVDGKPHGLVIPGSTHIYEAARPLTKHQADPLSTTEAHKLVAICNAPNWQHGISGILFAGFIVVAPICGGLMWRPSIWSTGGAGSGKSWLQTNILHPMMGGVALLVQGQTTEAGLRQELRCDAIPVLFDEAEREDAGSASRMQNVLGLMRQSSSEGGGRILKGTQTHDSKKFRIRSCFAMSSINVGIDHQADESRITILALRERDPKTAAAAEAAFEIINRNVKNTITPQYAAGMMARSVRLLPVIRENAEVFARAVSVFLGSRRTGDQIGTLLAGAYALHSDRVISAEAADAFVRKQDWGIATRNDVDRDERQLINHIIQHRIRINGSNQGAMDASIGRLIMAAADEDTTISAHAAYETLCEHGIRFDRVSGERGIFVSTNHKALKAIMQGTPWSGGWINALGRLHGSDVTLKKTVRFGKLHIGKAAWVPLETIDGGERG